MEYKKAFQRPFEDVVKVLIAIALGILPIVNFFVTGYVLENVRLLKKNKKASLPEWKNWGKLFMDGLMAFVIKLLYSLPALFMLTILVSGIMLTAGGSVIPFAGGFVAALTILWGLLTLPIFLFTVYISPWAVYQYALKRKFNDAFQFKLIFKKAWNVEYLKIFLIIVIYGLGLGIVLGGTYGFSYAVMSYLISMTKFTLMAEIK